MDKAIEIIRDYMKIVTTVSTQYHVSECKEAISELQAHKAKMEELKKYCKTQILLNDEKFIEAVMPEKSAYYQGLSRGYQNMLGRLEKELEELDK